VTSRPRGEARRDSIVAAAEDKAVQIKAQAAVTAEQETKLAVERLRAELADLVVEAARGMLAGKLSEKDQDKLVDEYLTKVVFN
jgi:F-type H+-transporting ATPase subunit b